MELLKAREAAMSRFRPMLRSHGLTEQQWRVIRALAEQDNIDAGELAQRSFLLAPSLTRILRHLEQASLIERSPDRADQRRILIALTPKGRGLFRRIAPESEAIYQDMEASFGSDRMATLYALLDEFAVSLSK